MGYPIFYMPVGLEPQVRVWPKPPCAAEADAAGVLSCAAVGVQRSRAVGKAHTASPQTDTGTT
jgi:hypothetical protein